MASHADMMARRNISLRGRYGATIVPEELRAENELIQPFLTLAQNLQNGPLSRAIHVQGWSTNTVFLGYKILKGPMQLGSPICLGILAPRGRHIGSGCQKW